MCQLLDQLKDELDNINRDRKKQILQDKSGIKKSQENAQKDINQSTRTDEGNFSVSTSNFDLNFDTSNKAPTSDLEKLGNFKPLKNSFELIFKNLIKK
jgi:hypothetical protein